MRVLAVDDAECLRMAVEALLQHLGHEVILAADKGSACRIINESIQEIDLILADCDLPFPDEGLEIIAFAQDIMDFFGHKNVPMILMSGRDRQAEAETIGVEFLPKPFTLEKLEFAIQRAAIRVELTHA